MADRWRGLIAAGLMAGAASAARGQENMISPPAPLPWPAAELDTTVQTSFAVSTLRREIELRTNIELCRQRMERNREPVPAGFDWPMCPQAHKDAIAAREGLIAWQEGARPTECGTECVGRPNLSQTTHTDRPNVVYTMLYGHLDFTIDTTVNRDVTYSYQAQFHCVMDPDRRGGSLQVRLEFGQPVVGEAGWLESFADFALLPLNLSRGIEAGIRAQLSGIGTTTAPTNDRCVSVGPRRLDTAAYDQIIFRQPARGARMFDDRAPVAAVGREATVRFLGVKRKPPQFGYTPPAEAGSFQVYLNGDLVVLPELPELRLPPSGGSASLNLCRTIDLRGADRLQVIFANSHGGGVWSQFPEHERFGAGSARRMTTGRTVVVASRQPLPGEPPPPGGTRPRSVVLREFELLYSIEYTPAPELVASESPTRDDGRVARPPGDREVERDPGRRTPPACRRI